MVIKILIALLLCCSSAFAGVGEIRNVIGMAIPAGGTTTACVGWPLDQTDCNYSESPADTSAVTSDTTWAYSWATDRQVTLSRVKIYFGSNLSITDDRVTVYNDTTLIATGTITASVNGWVWSDNLVAESGQSLVQSASTVLRFGYSLDSAGETTRIGREAQTPANYRTNLSYLPASPTWTVSSTNALAAILEYTY